MNMMGFLHSVAVTDRVVSRSSLWPRLLVHSVLTVTMFALMSCSDAPTVPDGGDTQPTPVTDDTYIEVRLTPEGGTFELWEGAVLRVPAGAVDELTVLRVRMLHLDALNRLLYERNTVAKHFADRPIGDIPYSGSQPWVLAGGIEVKPNGIHFNEPIQVELPALLGMQPTAPLQVKVEESQDALIIQSGTVNVLSIPNPTSPHPDIPPITHTLQYEITDTSTHAVVERPGGTTFPEWVDCGKIDRNDPEQWAKNCKQCGAHSSEQAEIDYTAGQCEVKQVTTRTTFHDCPGSPVEEHTQQILTPDCDDIEPIDDILNYRPGRVWPLRYNEERVLPITAWINPDCRSAQKVTLSLNAEVRILPKEDAEGHQDLDGSATMIMNATQEGCAISDYQLKDATTGPNSVTWDVTGQMHWHSPVRRPQVHIFVSRSLGQGNKGAYIDSQHRYRRLDGTWGEWRDVEIALEYTRILGAQSIKGFVPHRMSRTSTSADGLWKDQNYSISTQRRWPAGQSPREYTEHFSLGYSQ